MEWNVIKWSFKREIIHILNQLYFPIKSFEDLIETKMMDTLFDKFCIDEDDDSINEKVDNDNFIFNIIPDPNVERVIFLLYKNTQNN